MMFTISWLLALVALITVPLSVFGMRKVAARARPQYLAQWGSTGALNAQIEEAFTGHAVVKAFGRQARRRGTLRAHQRRRSTSRRSAPSSCRA